MTEEKPRHCHRVKADGTKCDSGARWGVRMHLNCVAPGMIVPTHLKLGIEVCDEHKNDGLIRAYVLTEENMETIRTGLMEQAGHPEPDFLTARFEFVPLERSVIQAQAPAPPAVKCDRTDCKAPATHQIKLMFRMLYQKGRGAPLIEDLTNFVVCGTHKELTDRNAMREAGAIDRMREVFSQRGITGVDFKTMEVGFVPLLDPAVEIDAKTGRIDKRKWVGDGQPFDLNPQLAVDPAGKAVN